MQFIGKARRFSLITITIVAVAIVVGIIFGGLNLGIDFTGGSILTVELHEEFEMEHVNAALEQNGIDPRTAQILRSENTKAVIRMQELPDDMDDAMIRGAIVEYLVQTYPEATSDEVQSVGGATTGEIIQNAFLSVIIAAALMLIYIWIRFELFSGLAAVTALLHDVVIMTAVVCIARIQINSSYIAACLTIVGYSINDTIVVFDRIRENNKKYGASMPRAKVADLSITETLPRTINTSLTTLVTILAVYIFGVQSIKEFALPLIVGLVSGTYSSIFVASPLWVRMLEARHKHRKTKMAQKNKTARKS